MVNPTAVGWRPTEGALVWSWWCCCWCWSVVLRGVGQYPIRRFSLFVAFSCILQEDMSSHLHVPYALFTASSPFISLHLGTVPYPQHHTTFRGEEMRAGSQGHPESKLRRCKGGSLWLWWQEGRRHSLQDGEGGATVPPTCSRPALGPLRPLGQSPAMRDGAPHPLRKSLPL